MPKAKLVFTQYPHSYKVSIPNLEKLSVEQIKELENFSSSRKGIFSFENYTFTIQKKLGFHEFVSLIKHSSIDAQLIERVVVKESQPRIGFGQYKGMQYNELPDSYMLWLKVNYRGQQRVLIEKELEKRNLS